MLLLRHLLLLGLIVPSVTGFAAKKKKSGSSKKRVARTTKGFGAAPPTFDEVVSKFRTRLPDSPQEVDCPCGSSKSYGDCCMPFHTGQMSCRTPTSVLRTRYTAFAYRLIKYVIETTHPTCRDYEDDKINWAQGLNRDGMFDSFEFVGLDAGPEESGDNDNEAFVDFAVRLRKRDDSKETSVMEKSKFLRDDEGVWSYASGEVRTNVAGLEDAVLNQ